MCKKRILLVAISAVVLVSLTGCENPPVTIQELILAQSASAEIESTAVAPTARPTPTPTPAPTAVPTMAPAEKAGNTLPIAATALAETTVPTPTPESTTAPTAKPPAVPTAVPTTVPKQEPTPEPTAKPTEKPKVWVVDVEGHYETVTETVTEQVWIEEQGHYEETKTAITAPMYTCNHCGAVFYAQEEAESHSWDEFDMGNAGSYTYQGQAVTGYDYEEQWIVDAPGHYEDIIRVIESEVWVDEAGHWE